MVDDTAKYEIAEYLEMRFDMQPSEDAEEAPASSFLNGRGVSSLAAFDYADARLGALIGLVELARLSIAESNPVAHGVTIGQRSAGHALPPVLG
jgi:hypothetical protein